MLNDGHMAKAQQTTVAFMIRESRDTGFDPSSLVYWRRRLAKSGRPHRVNDAIRKIAEETGVLKGRRRRAVDSTILADAVATQDTVTQLVSAIRRAARAQLSQLLTFVT